MLRNTIIAFFCLLMATSGLAQKKDAAGANNSNYPYKIIGSPMPPLRVVKLNGKVITNKNLHNNANLIMMMFNPTCEHCQDETELLEKNIFLFKQSRLLMIAAASMAPYLKTFETNYHTDQYPTIEIGLDSNSTIDKTFLYVALPQINIYNAERKLIKVFSGSTSLDSLKPYIQ